MDGAVNSLTNPATFTTLVKASELVCNGLNREVSVGGFVNFDYILYVTTCLYVSVIRGPTVRLVDYTIYNFSINVL